MRTELATTMLDLWLAYLYLTEPGDFWKQTATDVLHNALHANRTPENQSGAQETQHD